LIWALQWDKSHNKRVRKPPISGEIITIGNTSMIVEISKNKSPSTQGGTPAKEELPPPPMDWSSYLSLQHQGDGEK